MENSLNFTSLAPSVKILEEILIADKAKSHLIPGVDFLFQTGKIKDLERMYTLLTRVSL